MIANIVRMCSCDKRKEITLIKRPTSWCLWRIDTDEYSRFGNLPALNTYGRPNDLDRYAVFRFPFADDIPPGYSIDKAILYVKALKHQNSNSDYIKAYTYSKEIPYWTNGGGLSGLSKSFVYKSSSKYARVSPNYEWVSIDITDYVKKMVFDKRLHIFISGDDDEPYYDFMISTDDKPYIELNLK